MTNDNSYIDALIAEATAETAASNAASTEVKEKEDVVADNATAEDENPKSDNDNSLEEKKEDSSDDGDDGDDGDVEFPKKAKNALRWQRKLVAKEREKNAELSQKLAELEQLVTKSNDSGFDPNAPQESQFETYGDFLKAQIRYEIKKEDSVREQTSQYEQEQTKIAQESFARVQKSTAEFVKNTPDAKEVFKEYGETLDSFPAEIQQVMYELGEKLPLAVYNLAISGKLDYLAEMSPALAAIELGRATAQQPKAQSVNKISNAPNPPAHVAKGVGSTSSRDVSGKMSADELYKWTMSK